MSVQDRILPLLESTSRTFLLPILRLPDALREPVGQAYLCLRAIDEIEDHENLGIETKVALLQEVGAILGKGPHEGAVEELERALGAEAARLPEVTLALPALVELGTKVTKPMVWASTAEMALAMAGWAERGWRIADEDDLDQYTFDVAGRVGLLLSALWRWFDGTETKNDLAIGFGRALQAVNIIRNRRDDAHRGVDFFPPGWDESAMFRYARRQLAMADAYMEYLAVGPVREFCAIPLELARATLAVIENGHEKLSRSEVEAVVSRVLAAGGIKS
ncbi:MAG: squalene/phytoene synthase family protein [Opitutaceae bacterium]